MDLVVPSDAPLVLQLAAVGFQAAPFVSTVGRVGTSSPPVAASAKRTKPAVSIKQMGRPEVIRRRLQKPDPFAEFQADIEACGAVERTPQPAIDPSIDMAGHVVTDERLDALKRARTRTRGSRPASCVRRGPAPA